MSETASAPKSKSKKCPTPTPVPAPLPIFAKQGFAQWWFNVHNTRHRDKYKRLVASGMIVETQSGQFQEPVLSADQFSLRRVFGGNRRKVNSRVILR